MPTRIGETLPETMTAPRRRRNPWPALGLALVLALGGSMAAPAGSAGSGGPLVVNPETGLALSGYDPIAYFTRHMPTVGRPEHELSFKGAVWRFQNPGNRAAFVAHPEVYTPRFGGYDPVAVSRGVSVPGHPLLWALIGERLYLFYSDAARADFMADPGRIIAVAERKWPEVARTIAR
jgi:hypothetical protein